MSRIEPFSDQRSPLLTDAVHYPIRFCPEPVVEFAFRYDWAGDHYEVVQLTWGDGASLR